MSDFSLKGLVGGIKDTTKRLQGERTATDVLPSWFGNAPQEDIFDMMSLLKGSTSGQPERDIAAQEKIGQIKDMFSRVGPEFEDVSNDVLYNWLEKYIKQMHIPRGSPRQFAGIGPVGDLWDPAGKAMQGQVNRLFPEKEEEWGE